MGVYLAGLNLKGISWPETALLVQIVMLTTIQAVVMVSGAVVVSSQATSVRAANLLAGFIIIPIALLIEGESIVMFWGNFWTLWWVVAGLVVMAVLLVRVGTAHFRREELLGREIDVLNLRWVWRVFWRRFSGDAAGLADWYRRIIPSTLAELKTPAILTTLAAAAGLVVGIQLFYRYPIPMQNVSIDELRNGLKALDQIFPIFSIRPVFAIWWQNLRVLILAMVLGIFSTGVLGVLPLILTMGAAGYLTGVLTSAGFSWLLVTGFILPHGIMEIPLAVLASAAVLRGGALLGTPDPDRTVGETFVIALADWAKLMIGLVLPLLLAAAFVEVWATPRILAWLLG